MPPHRRPLPALPVPPVLSGPGPFSQPKERPDPGVQHRAILPPPPARSPHPLAAARPPGRDLRGISMGCGAQPLPGRGRTPAERPRPSSLPRQAPPRRLYGPGGGGSPPPTCPAPAPAAPAPPPPPRAPALPAGAGLGALRQMV